MSIITTIDALISLGITAWTLQGDPNSESEFNESFKKITGSDSKNNAILSSDPADFGVTWSQVSDKKIELANAEPMRLLRVERNRRLAETDFYALSDVVMSDAIASYRQELRDLTSTATPTLTEDGLLDFDSVTWPTKP